MMVALQLIVVVALIAVLIVLVVYAVYQAPRKRIGYIPLPMRALPDVVEALELPPDSDALFYDLGCGDGRVVAAALRHHPKLRAVGIEINPVVADMARWKLRTFSHRSRVVRGDLLKADLSQASRIFIYLNNHTMKLLEPKFGKELGTGTRVVACDFPLPNRKPIKTLKIGEAWQLAQILYIYEY